MNKEETYIIETNNFSIDSINLYLVNIKNILIQMNIKLDSQEINKFLALSLNNSLFISIDTNYKKEESFNILYDKWDDITKNIQMIEEQIRNFNKDQHYEYYVNIEDVIYLRFYKQIKYVNQIINEIIQYLSFGVNPVYIYTFIIQSFYDEKSLTENYMTFVSGIRNKINNEQIKRFLSDDILNKLGQILYIIYNYDTEFKDLIKTIFNNRIDFIKIGIITSTLSYPNNYNCQDKEKSDKDSFIKSKTEKLHSRDIEELEKNFYKLKCEMLFKKRTILLDDNFYNDIQTLFNDTIINCELWNGFILFLYKKFEFDYPEFIKKIHQLIQSFSVDDKYVPKLDYFQDLNIPKYEYEKKQKGGNNIYFIKYIKYKTKYMKLKNKNNY
jgi:hypothetical protein